MSTQTQIATIIRAEPRVVTRQSDGQQFTLNEVFTNIQPQPFLAKADVFNLARAYTGQQVEIVGRAVTNERGFTNYQLDYIGPIGAGTPTPTPQPIPNQPQPQPQNQERQQSIHRQVAAKVAAVVSTTPQEFWPNVNDLFTYFETGRTPMTNNPEWTMQQAMTQAQEAQAAAAGYVHDDSDIPFAPTIQNRWS